MTFDAQAFRAIEKRLPFREREILRLRYGVGTGDVYTLEEVGRIFKVTRERVRQVEKRALERMRVLSEGRTK